MPPRNAKRGNVILGKLEGNNPAGSVKDRPALSMIKRAEERGEIKPGDTLIEATSGNTGIALAMAAAIKGYRMVLIMPEDLSVERAQTMKAFGAELVLTPKSGGMEYARDLAEQMVAQGKGRVLDQFANPDNPRIHYETTGPEIWADTQGQDHALRERDGHHRHHHRRVALPQGEEPGDRASSARSRPKARAFRHPQVAGRVPAEDLRPRAASTEEISVSQDDAEEMCRRLAREEGIFGGISAAGALWAALQVAKQGRERHHRVRGVRSRRPLPVDRRLPRLDPPASRGAPRGTRSPVDETRRKQEPPHAPSQVLPGLRHAARMDRADGRRRPQGAPALPQLRPHALEQPDAGARGHRRVPRPGAAGAQRGLARARCSR